MASSLLAPILDMSMEQIIKCEETPIDESLPCVLILYLFFQHQMEASLREHNRL
jgi:hypothetical protein